MSRCTYHPVLERLVRALTTVFIVLMGMATFNLVGCESTSGDLTDEDGVAEDINHGTVFSGEFNAVMDVYGRDAEMILHDYIMMHEAVDPDYEFISEITEMADGWVEVRAQIPQLTVSLNGQTTTLDENGRFTFEDVEVQPGDTITVNNGEAEYVAHLLTENEVNEGTILIEDVFDFGTYVSKKECSCEDDSCPVQSVPRDSYPCLDNNGIGWGNFTYSDCFMSLLFGPRALSWMCWVEAMNTIHDHFGNTWCNGTHNCSLFVHAWNYGCQHWHPHTGYWTVGSSSCPMSW